MTLEATAAECRFFIERYAMDPTYTETQTFEFLVWPTRMPSHEGVLVDLDTTTQTYWEMPTNSVVTVRLSEMKHEKGYAWKAPVANGSAYPWYRTMATSKLDTSNT